MSYIQEPTTSIIPLLNAAHQVADEFCQAQSDLSKAEQIYLNTLAVYAVHDYLGQLGFSTNLESGDSWNPIMQTMINVADLDVQDYGKLECRPVLPDDENMYTPIEVWENRIGFIAVQINESLDEATLLGFTDKIATENSSIHGLQSIEALPSHFSQVKSLVSVAVETDPNSTTLLQAHVQEPIQLGQWLQGQFEAVWQAIEEVFIQPQTDLAWSARGIKPTKGINRVKVMEIGADSGMEQIALLVGVTPITETEMDIEVQVCPTGDRSGLPRDVQVRLLSDSGAEVGQARAVITETIQFQFGVTQGESFSVEVTSGNKQITETFVI